VDAREVDFFDLAALELRLHEFGEMPRVGKEDETAGVGVESVGGAGFQRMAGFVQDREECVAVEAPAGMDWQGRGFVDDEEGFVVVEDVYIGIDLGLDVGGSFSEIAFPGAHAVARRNRLACGGEDVVFFKKPAPFGGVGVRKKLAECFQNLAPVAFGGNHDGAEIVGRDAAGQGRGSLADRGLERGDALGHLLDTGLETKRTTLPGDESFIDLILSGERSEAAEALRGTGFSQSSNHTILKKSGFEVIKSNAIVLPVKPAIRGKNGQFLAISDYERKIHDNSQPLD